MFILYYGNYLNYLNNLVHTGILCLLILFNLIKGQCSLIMKTLVYRQSADYKAKLDNCNIL